MNEVTFTQRAQAALKDPRAGMLPATVKSLFTDMAAALDSHQRRLDEVQPNPNEAGRAGF